MIMNEYQVTNDQLIENIVMLKFSYKNITMYNIVIQKKYITEEPLYFSRIVKMDKKRVRYNYLNL